MDFPGGPVVKTSAYNAWFMCSIPGPRTRVPHIDVTAKKALWILQGIFATIHLNEEHAHPLTHTFPLLDIYSTETYNYTHLQKT